MCRQCELNPVYEFTNKRKLCKLCFVKWFRKKVLYVIRKFGMMGKGDVVCYCKGNSFRDVVLEDVLKMFEEKAPVKVVEGRKGTKVAVSDTADEISKQIVGQVINGKESELKKLKPVEGKVIRPLCLFLDKEVLLYAKIRKLEFEKVKCEKSNVGKFVDGLELKHPEIKNAIVKGFLGVYCK